MSPPLGILYVTDLSLWGGAERRLFRMVERLDRTEFRPNVCVLRGPGPLTDALAAIGVPWFSPEVRRTWSLPGAAMLVARRARRMAVGVIHGQVRFGAFIGASAGRLTGLPTIATRTHTERVGGYAYLDAVTERLASTNTAVSSAAAGRMHVRADCQVIPNGVEPYLGPAPEPSRLQPVILSVGSLTPIKNHRLLISALPEILAAHPTARIRIIGSGVLGAELSALAQRLGVAAHVDLAGETTRPYAALRGASVFVHPSLSEGMSNALLEAMSVGLPVVATRAGGNPETVDTAGIVVPNHDRGAMAHGIITLLQDPALAARLGAAAKTRVESRFSFDRMMDAYTRLYRSLGGRAAPHGVTPQVRYGVRVP